MPTFVIGDIHGHSQKLRKLVEQLQQHASSGDALVFVGDYVDRGPESRMVVEQVLALANGGWDGPVTCLKGNHEEMMLDAISRRPVYEPGLWLQNGGRETIRSYVPGGDLRSFAASLPPEHLRFYESLVSWHADDHGIYVHAGIRPGVSPGDSSDDDLLWIREPFIESDYEWDRVVVFGHTPQFEKVKGASMLEPNRLPWKPLDRPEKIGIDTGAAYGGPLSAVLLPRRQYFSVR
jgi:serine/threonine protein phosphatase 1